MKKMIGFALICGLFSANVFAEQYSLETAKEQVVNNNINVSIAYEQYVLVKNQSEVKTLQLLPSISVDMLIYNYQYSILRTLIPEPARFFEAAAQKDLAQAANINRTIVKKNLLEDLEKTLFLYQFHKEMAESFNKEADITNTIAARAQEAYDLGSIDFTEYYATQRNVIKAKTQKVNGNEIAQNDEYSLKLILQVKNNAEVLDISKINFYNKDLAFPTNVKDAANMAANNSKEVEQFDYLVAAANKQKKGVAISWISWGGVGFDYFARVSVAKSEVTKIELSKKKAIYEVKNQVAAQYADIEAHKEKINFQTQLVTMAQSEFEKAQAQQVDLLNSFINTKKAELVLIYAERELSRLNYELEIKFIKLKRLLGVNMMNNEFPQSL